MKKGISLRKKEREEKRKKAITLDDKQHIPPSLSGNSHRSLQATGHKVSINVNLENAHSYALSHHRNLWVPQCNPLAAACGHGPNGHCFPKEASRSVCREASSGESDNRLPSAHTSGRSHPPLPRADDHPPSSLQLVMSSTFRDPDNKQLDGRQRTVHPWSTVPFLINFLIKKRHAGMRYEGSRLGIFHKIVPPNLGLVENLCPYRCLWVFLVQR